MKQNFTRRSFLKVAGAFGLGSLLPGRTAHAAEAPAAVPGKVPTRAFGRTGVSVSILSLGGTIDIPGNQLMLKRAVDWGVTYWDTAAGYVGGKSEEGIGMFLEANPGIRKNLFIVTKSGRHNPEGMSELLAQSLERLKTDYVDLYFMHGISDPGALTPEVKAWAEQKKKAGKIRFFGFSTHKNMEDCLAAAARLDWVDGIMTAYNYRLMNTDDMKRAVDACAKAGIGLTAMKTIGKGQRAGTSEQDVKLLNHFLTRGFTAEQAKLKAVWENQQIASICSQMPNLKILTENVAAATDNVKLTATDNWMLRQEALATSSSYCAGCAARCEAAVGHRAPIADTMRCLMYYHGHGDHDLARNEFAQLPEAARNSMAGLNFAAAERACPHRLPIGKMIAEARELLA
jgi:hypothetical protein